MKNLILVFLIAVVSTSCMSKKQWKRKYPLPEPRIERVVDTVVQIRDTTVYIYIHADTVYSSDTIFVDAQTGLVNYPLHRLDVEYAYSTVQITNNNLLHHIFQKETAVEKTIQNAIKEALIHDKTVIHEPYPVYFEPTQWQRFKMRLAEIVMFMSLGVGVWAFLRFRSKIF